MISLIQQLLNGNGLEINITIKPLEMNNVKATEPKQKEEKEDSTEVPNFGNAISELNTIMGVDTGEDK